MFDKNRIKTIKPLLEVCCEGLKDVGVAVEGGADRIELCRDLNLDGLTPDGDTIREAVGMARRAGRPFRVMVLVRSRAGDFVYSAEEKETMRRSVVDILDMGADGVVVGSLNPELTVDTPWVQEIVDLTHSRGCEVTFHRAFDHVSEFSTALRELIDCGVDRVLTSGGPEGAEKGAETLARLVSQSAGRIAVMPGGGVRSSNIAGLLAKTNAEEFHSSCHTTPDGGADPQEIRRIAEILAPPHRGNI